MFQLSTRPRLICNVHQISSNSLLLTNYSHLLGPHAVTRLLYLYLKYESGWWYVVASASRLYDARAHQDWCDTDEEVVLLPVRHRAIRLERHALPAWKYTESVLRSLHLEIKSLFRSQFRPHVHLFSIYSSYLMVTPLKSFLPKTLDTSFSCKKEALPYQK